uniref:Alpha-2-macroglobulin bait region domain-containing protein n=1 Tax=Amphiprion percula TaxID=161767 RepID=A0A3P8U9M4_AMPPE
MKVCVVLWFVLYELNQSALRYLITAPLSLRLDAVETVLLQLFGFTDEVTIHVFLKTSMAPDHVVLAREVVTLNAQNHHQAAAKLFPRQLDKSVSHVILHVQSREINQHLSVPVSRSNGFLFIQTDKPLYTPHQSVKVRAFSLNQELRPANRSVFLKFKDPDQITVDIVEMFDVNNGIPSMQNPFKIPVKPKLGIWSIEASYSDDFTTAARTDFDVKEYVLPSFSIHMEPEANYISYGSFNRFSFKVSARNRILLNTGSYCMCSLIVWLVLFVCLLQLSSSGEVDVIVNMQKVLSNQDGPKDLNGVVGKYLYIAVLFVTWFCSSGGISQEAEFAAVKFVQSPYRLSLVSTPPFIKPGLPYNIQVLVKDHLDQPVNRVPVRLVERRLFRQGGESEEMPCPDSANSQSDGLAVFICNTPSHGVRAVLKVRRMTRSLIMDAAVRVMVLLPRLLMSRLPPQVLSKGKVVDFGSRKFVSSADNKQTLSFEVTGAMVPSVRLLVYYILCGEGTAELVADSVWLDVRARYGRVSAQPEPQTQAEPAAERQNQSERPVLRHIEQSDRGCGGGGGRDSADVFRLAGLTFITNANAQPTSSSTWFWFLKEFHLVLCLLGIYRLKVQERVNVWKHSVCVPGEILGEVLSVMHSPEGLQQLVNLPAGSAEAELGGLVLLVQVYQYLETSRSWNVLGGDIQKNSADLKRRIRDGLVGISSFRTGESSYSMWVKREPSTWLTAQVVWTLSAADPLLSVDHQSLSESVSWLIRKTQQSDGSFTDKSSFRANRVMVGSSSYCSFTLSVPMKVYDSMNSAANYISQHASEVKSMYVKAVAAYALTLHDPNSMAASQLFGSLENVALQKGGRIQYSNPILSWLTQDQHYGEGFYSVQDTALTLEALSEYSKVVSRAILNQDINVRYRSKGSLGRVQLSQSRPVATPIQVRQSGGQSSLTVMKIQLPTGVEAYLDDLRQVSAVLTQHPSMDPSASENLEAVNSGTDVELVKKATCSSVDLQKDKQYLVMGGGGAELRLDQSFRYRLPLDSDALVEAWPTDCSSPECLDYVSQLEEFALDLQLTGCP